MTALSDLTRSDLGEVLNALDDAAAYRQPDTGHCHDCTQSQMCDDHRGDQEAADSYRALRARLTEREMGS